MNPTINFFLHKSRKAFTEITMTIEIQWNKKRREYIRWFYGNLRDCLNIKERTPISAMLLVGRWDSLSIEVRECNCDQGGKKVRYYRWELQMCENVAF